MKLEKWYLDAVLDDGTVWYGYQARLKLPGYPTMPWVCGYTVRPDGSQFSRARWRSWPAPACVKGIWQWTGPDGFQAAWEPTSDGSASPLGSDDQFQVHWNCVVPGAVVRCRIPDADGTLRKVSGTGYIEHMRLETHGALPFKELQWGRAHAGGSSLVWIRWAAGKDCTFLLENGRPIGGQIEASSDGSVHVRTATGEWWAQHTKPLCDRDVRTSFPGWLVRLAGRTVPQRELKLTGTAVLRNSIASHAGTGIWEEVQWA